MGKATLDVVGVPVRRLILQCDVHDRRKASLPLGASNTKQGWTYPPDELVVQILQHQFGEELVLSSAAQKWFDERIEWRHRIEDAKIQQALQPNGICGSDDMKTYQLEMLSFGQAANRFINADDRGLGKTLDALALAESDPRYQKVICVVPGYLKLNWMREIQKWTGHKAYVCRGERPQRERTIDIFVQENGKYLVVNYDMIRLKKQSGGYPQLHTMKWDMLIADEAHRLQGRQSQQTEGAKQLAANTFALQELTGNPVDRPEAVWQLLNLIDPRKFSSYWTFVEYFCNLVDNFFGKEIAGINTARMAQFQYALQPYLFRRLKQEVAPHLPDQIFHTITVEMEGKQKTFYTRLEKQMVIELENGDLELVDTVVSKQLRLSQAIANPSILGGVDDSIVERTVVDLLSDLFEGTNKVIVGTWFVPAADLLEAKLSKTYKVFRVKSELKDVQRDAVVEAFKSCEEKAVLVGGIKAMSEGLNIDECDHVVLADRSYAILDNEQFIDRVHRMTSTRKKNYYIIEVANSVSADKTEILEDRTQTRDEVLSMRAVSQKMIARVRSQ